MPPSVNGDFGSQAVWLGSAAPKNIKRLGVHFPLRGKIVRDLRLRTIVFSYFYVGNGPRNGLAIPRPGRADAVGEQRAAHCGRGAGDEELDILTASLSGDAANGVRRGRIQKWHSGEIDHECLALVGDAVEHAADRRGRAEKEG